MTGNVAIPIWGQKKRGAGQAGCFVVKSMVASTIQVKAGPASIISID